VLSKWLESQLLAGRYGNIGLSGGPG